MTYLQQLKDPRWHERRYSIMKRDHWTCCECHIPARILDVHHKFYIRKKILWEYSDKMLETLCRECHDSREAAIKGLWTALLDANTGDFIYWTKKIKSQHKDLKKKLKAVAPLPLTPPLVLSPALINGGMSGFQREEFQRMRDAVNGLVKLQEDRNVS